MSDFSSRLKNVFIKYGVTDGLKLLALYAVRSAEAALCPDALFHSGRCRALVARILRGDHERVIVVRTSQGYNVPLFQRTQQLARALPRYGCLVLFEAAPHRERVRCAEEICRGLWLVNFRSRPFARMLDRAIEGTAVPRYLWLSSPERGVPVRTVRGYIARGYRLVYDYIDEISAQISASKTVPRETARLHDLAVRRGGAVILASSLALLRDAREKSCAESVLAENGADCGYLSRPGPCPDDAVFRKVLSRRRPRLCYYGAIAAWLDYEALDVLARDGRFDVVMIGPRYDAADTRMLENRENVFFLGPRPYAQLKDYAARCDVLLIPFKQGALGDAASPVKLFEYMAIGRPVVAGDIAECRRYDSVLIARDARDYVRCAEFALRLGRSGRYLAREREEALAADWSVRARTVSDALRAGERARGF